MTDDGTQKESLSCGREIEASTCAGLPQKCGFALQLGDVHTDAAYHSAAHESHLKTHLHCEGVTQVYIKIINLIPDEGDRNSLNTQSAILYDVPQAIAI